MFKKNLNYIYQNVSNIIKKDLKGTFAQGLLIFGNLHVVRGVPTVTIFNPRPPLINFLAPLKTSLGYPPKGT